MHRPRSWLPFFICLCGVSFGIENQLLSHDQSLQIQACGNAYIRFCPCSAPLCALEIITLDRQINGSQISSDHEIRSNIQIIQPQVCKTIDRQELYLPPLFYRKGNVGITRQGFYDASTQLWILHYLCDHPGDLNVVLRHQNGQAHIEGEILIIRDPNTDTCIASKLIPFESSLESTHQTLQTHGEGECLIIIGQVDHSTAADQLTSRWRQLLRRHGETNISEPNLHALSVKIAETCPR